MKIIKVSDEWHEPTFKNVRVKCSGCDSELEIESEDVMESNGVAFFVLFVLNRIRWLMTLGLCIGIGKIIWIKRNGKTRELRKVL